MDYMYFDFRAYKVPCIFLLFLLNCCCQNEVQNTLNIDFENNTKNFHSFKLSIICSSIDYIPLESNNHSLISSIKSLDIRDSLIILNDLNKCLLFNQKGKFLRQIGRQGNGPGEYNYTEQLKLINNKIVVPSSLPSFLNFYDFEGNFIKKVNLPTDLSLFSQNQISNFYIINDSNFLVQIPNKTGQERFRISLLNDKGEILKKYANTTYFESHVTYFSTTDLAAGFYQYDDKIRYKEVLNDTIWQVEKNSLIPYYVINRGKYGTPNNYRSVPFSEFGEILKGQIWIDNIFEIKEFIIIKTTFGKYYPFNFYKSIFESFGQLIHSQFNIIGIFNRKDEELFFIRPTNEKDQIEPLGFENDIDGGINFVPNYVIGDSLMIGWFESCELKRYVNSSTFKQYKPKFPEKKIELEKLAVSLNENDNPVLMLVKLKK